MLSSVYLIFFVLISVVASACVTGQDTQAQTLSSPSFESGVSTVQISLTNPECKACCSFKKVSFVLGTQKVSWHEAFVLCKQSGFELASVTSNEEEVALEEYLKSQNVKVGFYEGYWIAGTRHGSCGSDFVWLTSGKPMIYRKFSQGQPDNAGGKEACLHIFLNTSPDNYLWNDIGCDQKLGYVCQSSKSFC